MRVRLRPTAHAGVVLAIVLGALPAAMVGLDVAWVVVASGVSALLLAPLLARRQVRAFQRFAPPAQVLVHAGRTSTVGVTFALRSIARHVLVDLTRPDAPPLERERAPRTGIAVLAGIPGERLPVDVALRIAARGRSSALVATFESVYPFGLFRAEGRALAPCELVALPRVLRRGDAELERWLMHVTSGSDSSGSRPALRSSGLPVAFRHARVDDTARDIAWRVSARHMRWISVDRTPPNQERVTVALVTAVRDAGTASTHRSRAAFEAAVSVCATAIDRLTRAGHEVTLRFVEADADAAPAQIAAASSHLAARSMRALPHLLALTDVEPRLERDDARQRVASPRGGMAPRALRLLVLACAQSIHDVGGAAPAGTTLLLVDSNGRATTHSRAPARRVLSAAP